ncbi:HAMP domain-containing sensor histidine kinase [Cohnella silvisoli]|uniref:histidine kinase n=1 Tax=Cohnella silvisoli TaxID=2873699 RepID=A0ABV1L3P8_9BACL|nr:HAMP domain-containing sensor histidine kinase [Cohnella silvisoli]MCD9026203.1 HAMP domain-containing histidine kinase [Cohnella silvisoli]
MQTRTLKRKTLLRHWTFRYVVTLFLGLFIIGIVSVIWIRHTTMNERMQSLQGFSKEAAQYVVNENGVIIIPAQFYEWIDRTQRTYKIPSQFSLTVFDGTGKTLFYKAGPGQNNPNPDPNSRSSLSAFDPIFPSAPPLIDRIHAAKVDGMYALSTPVHYGESVIGTVAISYSYQSLTNVDSHYGLIAALLSCSGLLGWVIIYLLTVNLRKPITQLSSALKKIEDGEYRMTVQENVKEKEIHDLLVSFKAMAIRLEQLEKLRTDLLAGVTHELRTPITSIHGLIHAVRDKVVTDSEAEEFLDISLKENARLQQMVSDLLDFNAFASGKINIHNESIDLGKFLAEIVYQWGLVYQDDAIELYIDIPDQSFIAQGDASRIQQIVINLLNNSKQALKERGKIIVSLAKHSNTAIEILVKDDGTGIPEDEQINIFERYYHGEKKKLTVGGLGLGLTFSRMLATAMNGQLNLKESSPQGTTFQLLLPSASSFVS